MTDNQTILKTIGANIRKFRIRNNWTQLDLEVHSGIDKADISKIENGLIELTAVKMIKLTAALKVQLSDIYKI